MTEKVEDLASDEVIEAEKPEIQAETPALNAEDGIEGLKKQLEAEKSRREAAERQAKEAQAQVHKTKAELQDNELHLVRNAIETIKQNAANLRNAKVEARRNGDVDREVDIDAEIAANAAKLLHLEQGRQGLEERIKAPPQPAYSDKVEAFAQRLEEQGWGRSAAWIRAHPECINNPRMYKKMEAAHNMTDADGIQADTDQYFEAIENYMGFKKPSRVVEQDDEDDDGTQQAARQVARRSSPAAAPVSRSVPNSAGTPRSIRLTEEQREIAKLTGMTEKEYYEQTRRAARERSMN